MQFKFRYLILILALIFSANLSAQSRKSLEARRIQLQKDRDYINALLSNTKRTEKNLLVELVDLNKKISSSEKVINAINRENRELSDDIYRNQLQINKNKRDLEALKKDYGAMIYKSYKSKSQNSRIMFLLSSENFSQAYKRFQYMKQYTSFRKMQGEEIQIKTVELEVLADSLKVKKELKTALLNEKKNEQSLIENEKKQQQVVLNKVKQKENKYERQLKSFLKEEKRIDAKIDKIIRDAIAASNKKSTSPSGSAPATFKLTAEAKVLASQFAANKDKLPWPVEKGFVSLYYGKQRHPIVRTATIQSNGVRITTAAGSKARAVFNGTVLAVQVLSGNKKAVLIQHGNYITVYKNLEKVTVSNGDKVKTKEEIGTIFTDKVTGKTVLGFVLSKNTKTENPASWIYKM